MRLGTVVSLGILAASGSIASADVILTWGYTDLAGSYDATSGQFQAVADGRTSGDVTRLAPTTGTADFNPGFESSSPFADAQIFISVFNKLGNTAQGQGRFILTDHDGDQLFGTIDGTWIAGSLGIYFNGDLTAVDFAASGGGTTFDGSDGGSFDMDLPGDAPYIGAFVQLFLRTGTGGFFTRDFDDISVQSAGEIIPGAGSFALLGLAGGVACVRRRRN
ncbi:MAG: hypothetical protein IT439_07895 [Phycisphaerales bacterium]|nr:hypothetical protein [Phycisphaerales bacterium]